MMSHLHVHYMYVLYVHNSDYTMLPTIAVSARGTSTYSDSIFHNTDYFEYFNHNTSISIRLFYMV